MPTMKQVLVIAVVSVLTAAVLNRVQKRVPLVAKVVNG